MRKRFIILIDFSEYSGNLIKYACDWSKQTNVELLLVHQTIVLSPVLANSKKKAYITQHTNAEALQKLKTLARELIPNTIKVSYSVSETNLQLTLPKLLAEPFENLIFVALKGTRPLKKILIGSVAIQVIDNTQNIIVAIPKEISTFTQKKIFIAVAAQHPFNILELNNFLKFIDPKNVSLTFFYLSEPNEETTGIEKKLSELSKLYADNFITDFAIYKGHKPFDDIKEVINKKIDELLIVQRGSRLLTDQLFRRFLINDLVYEGQTPLIVLP